MTKIEELTKRIVQLEQVLRAATVRIKTLEVDMDEVYEGVGYLTRVEVDANGEKLAEH